MLISKLLLVLVALFTIVSAKNAGTFQINTNTASQSKEELVNEIKSLLSINGEYSVYIYNLLSGEEIEINADQKFQAASVAKILVALAALKGADSGKYNREYIATNVSTMINRSSNSAWDSLNYTVGFTNLQKFAEDNGIEGTWIYENEMTTKGVGIMLKGIYENKFLKTEANNFLLSQMLNTNNEIMLPESVPNNVKVYHKTGAYLENLHDAGIVENKTTPYIIVIFTNDDKNVSENERIEAIKKVGERVYSYIIP